MAIPIFLSAVLALILLSFHPAQAFQSENINISGEATLASGLFSGLEIYAKESFKDFVFSETPPTKDLPRRDELCLLGSLSPGKPEAVLPGSPPRLTKGWPRSSKPNKSWEKAKLSDRVLTRAYDYLHTPYRRGGSLQTGRATDCSGFVQHIYKNFQIDLPRSSAEQSRVGKLAARTMDFSKLKPGDLLFFSRAGRYIGHVGIYLGEEKMIHASSRRRGVVVTDLRQPYHPGAFVVAKRLFDEP